MRFQFGYPLFEHGAIVGVRPQLQVAAEVGQGRSRIFGFPMRQSAAPIGRSMVRVEFESALKVDPEYADAHFNLAVLYFATGAREKGMKELKMTLALDPKHEKGVALWKQERGLDRD